MGETETQAIEVQAVDFEQFEPALEQVVPTVLGGIGATGGIVISVILIKKVWGMVKSAIKKA